MGSTFTARGSTNITNWTSGFTVCWFVRKFMVLWAKSSGVTDCICHPQVQNGIAIYATWTTIASLVNLSIVLIKDTKMAQADAVTVSFSILTVVLFVW